MDVVLIDNYDSFTYNLVQYLGEVGERPEVYRNDEITVEELRDRNPEALVISPGPGRPEDAGISNAVLQELSDSVPTLGVCLGLQCIADVHGGTIVEADKLLHGKTSEVHHDPDGLYADLSNPFEATRYHSLVVDPAAVPSELQVTSETESGEIMGLQHDCLPQWGVQFHPESILTDNGRRLLRNFLDLAEKWNQTHRTEATS